MIQRTAFRDRHLTTRDALENRHALLLELIGLHVDQIGTRQTMLRDQDGLPIALHVCEEIRCLPLESGNEFSTHEVILKWHKQNVNTRTVPGYLALESGQPTGFNPFQCERNDANVQFLADLVKVLAGKREYSAREEEDIFRAVESMLDTPMHLRSMTNFQKSLPNMGDDGLYARIRKWTRGNSLGWVFDNPSDTIDLTKANIVGFDYTDIIDNPEVRIPVINYLIHRLEELIDGRRLIYVMDEFWKILDGEGGLKEFAKNKQKTIRKQNGLGIFATQSPEDALQSDIAAALIEQTATMVLLPNPNASKEDYIDGLKLTESEFNVIKSLDERSRCFLVKQGHASSVCQLNLRGMDDALAVISASTDNIEILHQVLERKANELGVSPDDLQPDQWLQDFYDNRKGSGKGAGSDSRRDTAQERKPVRAA